MRLNNKPCHVIQIFNNSYVYDKKYKNYDSRKEYVKWKEEVNSETSFKEKVLINRNCYENRIGVLDNLIILFDSNFETYEDYLNLKILDNQYYEEEDWNQLYYKEQKKEDKGLILGTLSQKNVNVGIFKMKMVEEIELFINWDYWTIGNPKREQFKIAELKLNYPVNIKVDGKTDFSFSGRRKRTFIENNLIIEYKGLTNDVEVLKGNESFKKEIPKNCKEINLLRHLK